MAEPAPVPERPTLPKLREAAAGCRACDLWRDTTQTVFGAGTRNARAVFVGEQPGDREDREGKPFVGPAGGVFDRGLREAGIERRSAYVTNAVKHFRHQNRGKRRIHQRPAAEHMRACRPWLDAELAVVRPEVVVPLGAVAVQALFGGSLKVTKDRGRVIDDTGLGTPVVLTVHPSSILRSPDDEARHAAMEAFVADLRVVAEVLGAG